MCHLALLGGKGLRKSLCNFSHNWHLRLDAHTAGYFNKALFPTERSLLKLQSKQTRQTNQFSRFFWYGFFSSPQSTQTFSPACRMACAISHVNLASQSFCWVNYLGGKIPATSLLFVWCAGRYSQKRFAGYYHKEYFQGQGNVSITVNFQSLQWKDHCWVMVTVGGGGGEGVTQFGIPKAWGGFSSEFSEFLEGRRQKLGLKSLTC